MAKKSKTGSSVNRKYKDSVFRAFLCDDTKILVKLYNAVAGTNYSLDTSVKIRTLTRVLSAGIINDLAFELGGTLVVLIEHQSTINNNMPLRMLRYAVDIYNSLVEENALYRRKMQKLPRLEFIVFYNGPDEEDDFRVLKLSDMYIEPATENSQGGLELTVMMYNINKGRNPEIARRCPEIDEYSTFNAKVYEYKKDDTVTIDDAVKQAIAYCLDNNILKPFLDKRKTEVVGMFKAEWDMDIALKVREEEGREEGRIEEKKRMARAMLAKGKDKNEIAEFTGLTIDDILRL
jgi:predicted transposase YdaD